MSRASIDAAGFSRWVSCASRTSTSVLLAIQTEHLHRSGVGLHRHPGRLTRSTGRRRTTPLSLRKIRPRHGTTHWTPAEDPSYADRCAPWRGTRSFPRRGPPWERSANRVAPAGVLPPQCQRQKQALPRGHIGQFVGGRSAKRIGRPGRSAESGRCPSKTTAGVCGR
jgi:hypothetical protein